VDPERFHQVMIVILIGRVERRGPFLRCGDDLFGIAFAEFDLGEFADAVLGFLEQVEQRGNGLAVDFLGLQQRAAFIGDAVNAPVSWSRFGSRNDAACGR
jgi:hypothetical protein